MNFRKTHIFIWLLLLICACHPDKTKTVDESEIRMQTTDASELYFKNVRQSEYVIEEMPDAGMNVFSRDQLKLVNGLQPVIILNWRNDMAFFFFKQPEDEETMILITINGEKFSLDLANQRNHLELGRKIYNATLNEEEILIGDKPIFSKPESKDSFCRMYFDYLRLVDIR